MTITDREKYIGNTIAGLTGGAAAFVWCPRIVTRQYIKYLNRYGARFSTPEQHDIWNAAQKAFKNSPIKDSVQLIDYNKSNWKPIADKLIEKRKEFLKQNKNPFVKLRALTWPTDKELKERLYVYAQGKNACYMPATSQILTNKEKKANAVFHEMGHALNAKGLGLGKILAKTRAKGAQAVPFVFGISMLTPKDSEDNPTKNKYYKGLLTLKKHAGLIASACLLPLTLEEGLASIKGGKMAKEVLSPELYKKVNKSNIKAFIAYSISMIMVGAGTALANYIKDKVTGPLPKKSNNQELIEK